MKQVLIHIVFWAIILYWRSCGDYFTKAPFEKFIWYNLIRLPVIMTATYTVVYFLLPRYLVKNKNYLKFIILFILTTWLALRIDEQLIQSECMCWAIQPNETEHSIFIQLHPFRNSFFLFSVMGIASMMRFFNLYLEKEKRANQLIQERLETQHAFLKAQVNPHFLFNALNNLYSMAVQKNADEIATGLESLAGIMHYLTYESSAKLVPLKQEIQLIQDYLDIQHLRMADIDDTTISFQIEGHVKEVELSPVILLPLVENAFKHGVKPDHKCLVSITLAVKKDVILFKIKNTLFQKSSKEIKEKGIGLENVKKRLQLIYPRQHHLEIREENGYFLTSLRILKDEEG